MNTKHLPEMMATQKFVKVLLFKVITNNDVQEKSYAVQYHCKNRSILESYLKEDATRLRKSAVEKFGEQILSFRTELEQIFVVQ